MKKAFNFDDIDLSTDYYFFPFFVFSVLYSALKWEL